MTTWIIASQLKTYDSDTAFRELGEVDWNETKTRFERGDIVYIYISAPISAVGIKCEVTAVGLTKHEIDDKKFWVDKQAFQERLDSCTWMRLKCITIFNAAQRELLKGRVLEQQGLKGGIVLSRQRISDKLLDYIKTVESNTR